MARVTKFIRQQYSKIGNTREQLLHAWRSFSFDENTEMIDTYVTHIRQVAALLGYGEPQILEVFKNTLLTKLYWILFPIEDFRQAVETAKRILTKEKLDRKLTRQSSSIPFMSIREGHNRKVSFDPKEELGDKIDKLAVIRGKLATRESVMGRQFKPHTYQNRGRCHSRNYNQRNYQTGIDQIGVTEDSIGKIEVGLGTNRITGEETSEETLGALTDRIVEETIERNTEMTVMIELETGLEKGQM